MHSSPLQPAKRRGFSLVEVTLAIGISGLAVLSLVGILGSTFQQVDDIMQTNRALSGVTRLIGALDNPRSIVYLTSSADINPANTFNLPQGISTLDPSPTVPASNFEIIYRLLYGAKDRTAANAVWLYVYDRKLVMAVVEAQPAGANVVYNLYSNPSSMEVASCKGNNDNLTVAAANTRKIVGTPMRVRLSLSNSPAVWAPGNALPSDPNLYALAYLPVVAEFFPHDYSDSSIFKNREETPVLVQTIIVSR